MKPARLMLISASLFCGLTATALYAVCVTPKQLTASAESFSMITFTKQANFVFAALNGLSNPVGKSLSDIDSNFETGDPNLVEAAKKLAKSDAWQPKIFKQLDLQHLKPEEKDELEKKLELMQTWATYGELIVAVEKEGKNIAIVVPGSLTTDSGDENWKEFKIPCIAYALDGGKGVGKAPMSKLFKDPSIVSFFRYKN